MLQLHAGAELHCELLTHWLFFEHPLQQRSHTHGVSTGLGPQPAVTPFDLQQVLPTQLPLQHSPPQLQADWTPRHAGALQTLPEH